MKKIILILLVLTMTSIVASSVEISDNSANSDITIDLPDDAGEDDFVAEVPKIVKNDIKTDVLADKVAEINSMRDDEAKVKAWARYSSKDNYVIINKKDCSATVYDKNGIEINRFEIGVGREIGDDFNDTRGVLGKAKNTTPAGEFTLITNVFNKSAYGDITLSLGAKANKPQDTKKVVALHKVPKFRAQDRLKKFYDGNLANNRMSHGCINFMEDDFKELTKYIHGGLKTYVLPEEEDNQLMLTKNSKGDYELTQTKY